MDTPNFKNKCYRTKDDKRHQTIWGTHTIENETAEAREQRIANLRKSRGTWVYDPVKKEVVRKEDLTVNEIDAPQISKWDSEYSLLATGQRMSKRELKSYCKSHGKIWTNE